MRLGPNPATVAPIPFDAIIIGAGINGLGIARDAAMRGLKVLVLDKGDLGSGTSSWSSRLIHGGLRYLEHAELGLVRESLRERELLLHLAPHLVQPVRFVVPFYRQNRRGPLTMRIGMFLYDLLSYDKSLERHRILTRADTLRQLPGLNPHGLRGAAVYYDAQVSMAERLCVENALSARAHGAVILTYGRADRLLVSEGTVRGVEFTDLLADKQYTVRAPLVINVTGPWVDQVLAGSAANSSPLIGGTKGSHLVVEPFPGAPDGVVHYEAISDGRAILVIPWNGRYLIGSTDIRYGGDLDRVVTDDEEVEYLIRETNRLIPGANLTAESVVYAYAGVRPLPYQDLGPEAKITRRHIIHCHGDRARGLISIVGGKLTTYRSLAEQTVDMMFTQLGRASSRCVTAQIPLPGAAIGDFAGFARWFERRGPLTDEVARRLVRIYGVRALEVLDLAQADPALLAPLYPGAKAIGAEILMAFEREMAQTLADALGRRTMVGLDDDMGLHAAPAAIQIAQRHLGWDSARAEAELAAYRAYVERFRPRQLRRRI